MKTINDVLNLCIEMNEMKGMNVYFWFFGQVKNINIRVNINSFFEIAGTGNVEIFNEDILINDNYDDVFNELLYLKHAHKTNAIDFMAGRLV